MSLLLVLNIDIGSFVIVGIGLLIVVLAAERIARVFQKVKLPLITGFIITGIIAGSSVLNFITEESINKLEFLIDIALSIIAFSAGAELYLNELRSRINSIKWMTIGQLIITFALSSVAIYFFANYIPFMREMSVNSKIAVAILFGTIFVARSPSSAIAVINEMRANGPFTKTVMGVTVLKDVLVIILFAISFSIAKAFIVGEEIGILFIIILLFELILSFGIGIIAGNLFKFFFSLTLSSKIKSALIILTGYSIYLFASFLAYISSQFFIHEIIVEPLLICILASFVITNYSKHRIEFSEQLKKVAPVIYIIFFTLTGASLSFHVLMSVFGIAVALFFLRLITMFFGGVFGVLAAQDPKEYTFIAWMPFITQAGVALGLATIVANEFPVWGHSFETIVIAIIVINQLVGPPLFKWSLNLVKESHLRAQANLRQNKQDALIIGVESQSIALANQLVKHNWKPRLVSVDDFMIDDIKDFEVLRMKEFTPENLKKLDCENVEVVVLMLSDSKNYEIAEIIYEHVGTKEVIVRLNKRENFNKFHKLGALIIEPTTAIVSLLDHFVRSPNAATLLLGMDEGQDSVDVEILNNDIHGMRLRELRIPSDIIVLSIKRKGQIIISHGYTRLRLGDIITLVGAEKSLEEVMFKFET
ncbi:MAG: cation:proton antiporter [Bacteroidetes bacterium]|nr:cation:proton antiporter [Bacteroidota bacterium]MBL6943057.1 cation:proton antiporter [Bacteroidales bacterium]